MKILKTAIFCASAALCLTLAAQPSLPPAPDNEAPVTEAHVRALINAFRMDPTKSFVEASLEDGTITVRSHCEGYASPTLVRTVDIPVSNFAEGIKNQFQTIESVDDIAVYTSSPETCLNVPRIDMTFSVTVNGAKYTNIGCRFVVDAYGDHYDNYSLKLMDCANPDGSVRLNNSHISLGFAEVGVGVSDANIEELLPGQGGGVVIIR